jgi:glutamate:GABA antiporter
MTASASTPPAPHLERVLGLRDVVFMIVAGILNLNTLAPAVAHGPAVLLVWPVTFALLLVPQCITVIELSQQYPGEGAVYVWPREFLGEAQGFLSGWCYWMSNVVYVPALIVSSVGLAAFAFMGDGATLPTDGLGVELGSFVLLALLVALSIRGLVAEKWLVNAAALGTLVAGGILLALAGWLSATGRADPRALHWQRSDLDWPLLSVFSLTCYSVTGFEIASNLGDEIREPRRVLPRGVALGALISAAMYVILSVAMLVSLPPGEVSLISGLMPAVARVAGLAGVSGLVPAIAGLASLSVAGAAAAWIASPARVPYVAAVDGHLPAIFARLHPRYLTPHVALLVFAALCSLSLAMSFAGATLNEAFLTILNLAVILTLAQYLFMYSSLLALVVRHRDRPTHFGRPLLALAGGTGLATTLFGTVVAFIPSSEVAHVWSYELKLGASSLAMVVTGIWCFRAAARRRTREARG